MDKIYVVTDLGPGDGGKGGIVHALSCAQDDEVNLIIKRGGAQGSHGVHTSYEEKFNFSQWGCGTLEGIPTFCSEQMIISPVGLKNESEALKRLGIADPFLLLTVDPSCICATPFHKISSQLEELLLKDKPRGTIGTGVGRAYRMQQEYGDAFTIYAAELTSPSVIRKKLRRQCDFYRGEYNNSVEGLVLAEDVPLAKENLMLLSDDKYLQYCVDLFITIGKKLNLAELADVLSKSAGTAIVECSHGVLTDADVGLKPHVSAIRTLPKFTVEMLRAAGYDGRIINFAVRRAYEIRHGAGPMPTYDEKFTQAMLPGSHKEANRWQGIVRAGALDFNLFRYALECCKETQFDGLCLTWFDQIISNNRIWPVCSSYESSPPANMDYVEFLQNIARPRIERLALPTANGEQELFCIVSDILRQYIKLPLVMLSVGPTETDKIGQKNIRRV